MDELALMQGMNDTQLLMFQAEMGRRRKNPTTGVLLALFLGGWGAHRFYLGQVLRGFLYILFFWTFIPLVFACVEIFLMRGRVEAYNAQQAVEVAAHVRLLGAGRAA